ncbi:hypothetical protein PV04_07226 [Phialophora macrospora]|uniref:Uncharacterized protein n=1 Tax=Phialophora macrospora TaxID=1851006 RepID=A0A0D2FYE6_9EURO|nr:hypothetical protein PV04_07226 [Phialophora macrospora]
MFYFCSCCACYRSSPIKPGIAEESQASGRSQHERDGDLRVSRAWTVAYVTARRPQRPHHPPAAACTCCLPTTTVFKFETQSLRTQPSYHPTANTAVVPQEMVVGDAEAAHRPLNAPGIVRPVRPVQPRASSLPFSHGRPHHDKSTPADGVDAHASPLPVAADVALAALTALPTPILVLSSTKTVLLANAAVRRLLGINEEDVGSGAPELLKGKTLSQLGIDMVSDGVPIWVSWERFLDNLADSLQPAQHDRMALRQPLSDRQGGETTRPATQGAGRGRLLSRPQTGKSQDTVVDVVISSRHDQPPAHLRRNKQNKQRSRIKATCRMIITIWNFEDQRFFTLTFTTSASPSSDHSSSPSSTRNVSADSTGSSQSSQSQTPLSSTTDSQATSPAPIEQAHGVSFPSIAPPPKCTTPSTLTDFQKILKMKNAMLRAIEIPLVAMWRDESVVLPNLAAQKLLEVKADPMSEHSYDFMSRLRPWTSDFSREIDENNNPIVALCRDQRAFTNWQVGLLNERTGARSSFDVSGHPVYDERSGEFLAGLIAFKDVTEYTEQIAHQTAENEEQFRLICDMMPQMIFTTTPDGSVTYWSQRWYDYTGLTPADSLGQGWTLPFHEEDMPETSRRWLHSLSTGEEYTTEYRCKGVDGQWRWMLGRALPMRDYKTGEILKWFGTCTDIQDIVDAKVSGQRARQQLLDVLKHSQMTMWIIDREQTVTFYEGDFVMGDPAQDRIIGSQVLDVVGDYLAPQAIAKFKDSLARLLSGASDLEILENEVNSRWFRSKMVPMKGKTGPNGVEDENYIAGVIVIGSDVTGLRLKEQENIKLLANEAAAKEASKMKSSFLANMSHEIRTPIAGVLGMSELLMDTNLDSEQSEFAQNIQRSANSLLTVINDILDFSKIESGRLDIEEVRFSLGVVLRDVAKMLSFAAQRKGLQFGSDIRLGPSEDLILLGDPGRIRQILVNLLTNSIKFTSEGYVRLSADILSENLDTVTVEFCVEDSGIGIEEEVKKRLFRPFSQADSSTARRFGGTGLGLTISKNLVDLMHGTIRLESKLDAGTKATFSVPLKRPEYQVGSATAFLEVGSMPDRLQSDLSMSIGDSPRPESRRFERGASLLQSTAAANAHDRCAVGIPSESATQTIEPELPRDQIHVLVVEDNPVNQQIALKFIQSLKFSVNAVWNGREALEYLLKATSPGLPPEQAKEHPVPSLILMDVQMPVLDGYHATHMLRHHAPFKDIQAIPHIPIVAMTASAIQGDREKCEKAGMDDYMAKPVKRSLLEKTILKWVSPGRTLLERQKLPGTGTDFQKPNFGRACTDHSSTCTQDDAIATEFYARNGKPATQADADELNAPLPVGESRDVEGRAVARRSSISRALLKSEIPGGETEADLTARRAAAEDQARALRDAKLLSATDIAHGRSRVAPVLRVDKDYAPGLQAPNTQESESTAGASPMALTEENVLLLNAAQDGVLPTTETSSASPESLGLTYPVSDIPGPPPESTLSAITLTHIDGDAGIDAEALDSSIPEEAQVPAGSRGSKTASDSLGPAAPQSRRDVGGLGPESRQASDWSSSTARPEKS